MDEVGRDLVPGVETISARFHARRATRTPMERAILRITGLDLKMEQYARGERFVAAVERAAGPAGLRRLWDGPGDAAAGGRAGATRALGRGASSAGRGGRRAAGGVTRGPRDRAGHGPGGVPRAIALSPILSARYRPEDLAAIRAAAPGARARDGLARGPGRRPARRRRGPPPRLARRRRLRAPPRPRAPACAGSTRRRRASSGS